MADQHEGEAARSSAAPPARGCLRGRGGWSARPAAAGPARGSARGRSPAASASRRRGCRRAGRSRRSRSCPSRMSARVSRSCSSAWPSCWAAISTSRAVAPAGNRSSCGRYPSRSCRAGLDRAGVGRLQAGEDLEQRGLARAVRADQAGVLGVVKRDRDVPEQRPDAEGFAEGFGAEQQRHRGTHSRTPRIAPASGGPTILAKFGMGARNVRS